MLKNKNLVAGLIAVGLVVAAVAFWMTRRGGQATALDLIALLGDAEKSTRWTEPGDAPFTVKDVTIAGQMQKAIFVPPHSRIRWKIQVPRRGAFEVWYGVREDGWSGEGNGVQFRIGVSDGRTYEEYFEEVVNPHGRDRDRRWFSATIDLSAYEGQLVELNLNTDPGPKEDAGDKRNDFAVWGEPKVKAR